MNLKNLLVFVSTVVITIIFIIVGYNLFKDFGTESSDDAEIYRAKVVSVDNIEEKENYFGNMDKIISFTAKIKSGKDSGTDISCIQDINNMFIIQDKEIEKGDSILVSYTDMTSAGEFKWIFMGYNRTNALIYLCSIFLLLIAIIGRKKGIKTIISLILTFLIIFLVYVPSILSGFNVYLSTVIVGAVTILMSLLLINGANKKTLCAVLGNLGGVFITGAMAFFMNNAMKLTGIIDEQYIYLSYVNPDQPLNLVAIVWGGMVLGSLGAIMDVAMSIASSMHELDEHMRKRSFTRMLRSGMNIGRDAIGTMSNTLILAYIGGSLALVLLLIAHNRNMLYLFSMEMIAVQVVQAITGSMGILFAVPFTAVFSAYIYNKNKEKKKGKPPGSAELPSLPKEGSE